ncbi:TetR family transcriptional regulator [Arthrobacter sp. PAMC25564]|uniref:TetR family transcriptional regulator n=1 Tax=Arthrobacter sp. PAMC25564 TaxID=2565366 RepID=UPI0010A2693A|nr:TetR family transcriptional regulator [Arthrobacter sp. PAMC25564]QCB95583.1 TetR family transcriptional regulator [Arthrobacter sp. PAMC25564]
MREIKQHRSQAKQELMAAAAARLLIDEGPSAVTHRRAAEAAGLAAGSGNYYFPSKKELFRAAVAGAEDLRSESALKVARDCHGGEESLTSVALRLMAIYFAPKLGSNVVTARLNPILEAGHDPELQEIIRNHQPLLAGALNIGLERMTGQTLASNDMKLLMQTIGASLLYGFALGEDDLLGYSARSIARILDLLDVRVAAAPDHRPACPAGGPEAQPSTAQAR